MSWSAVIFVEGKDDAQFISSYLQSIEYEVQIQEQNKKHIEYEKKILIYPIRGTIQTGKIIFNKINLIEEKIRENNNILFLLDADNNFIDKKKIFDNYRNKTLEEIKKEEPSDTTAIDLFLMPGAQQAGNLETILREISVKKEIYDCFDLCKTCLTDKNYKEVPDAKGEIYAYCKANGIESNEQERNYQETDFWNLNAPILDPLKDFLTKHLNPPQTP